MAVDVTGGVEEDRAHEPPIGARDARRARGDLELEDVTLADERGEDGGVPSEEVLGDEGSPGGKWIIMNRTAGRAQGVYRPMLFDNGNRTNRQPTGQLQRWWYPCLQTLCTMHNKNDRFDQPFYVSSTKRIEEWVSFEFEADLEKSKVSLYIHTEDGKVRGLYASHDMRQQEPGSPEDYPIIMIQGLGFFWNRADENAPVAERDDNTHIKIDEVRIDTSYIGPPADFVSSGR